MTEDEVINQVYKLCSSNIQSDFKLFLFGSRASGQHTPTSDFDFYIDSPKITSSEFDKIQGELENLQTLYKIDLIDWHQAPEHLKQMIKFGPVIEILNEK